jgi:hypothetical protein
LAGDSDTGKRQVTVGISCLASEALLEAATGAPAKAPATMRVAVRCYLGDRDADRPAWPYPSFLRGSEPQADVPLEFDVDADLWREFEAEASKQGVSVDQLAEHAAFYFVAEANAGNLTQRILNDLDPAEDD